MTRGKKIAGNIAIGLGAFLLLALLIVLVVVQTAWFRNYVRAKIIATTEEATGGRVNIDSFNFEVSHLRAVVGNFVIHGREPASAAPFLQAERVQVDLRFFTSIHHLLDIAYLGVDKPRVNVFVMADGNTNAPVPKQTTASKKTPLETVVDLAVGRFELTNGLAMYDSRTVPINLRANNVRAQLYYNIVKLGYQGRLEMEPLYVVSGRNTPVNFKITLPVSVQRDRVDFQNAAISTPLSSIAFSGSLENLNNPKITVHLNGHIATADLQNAAGLPLAVNARNVPSLMDLDANAVISDNVIDVTGLRATLGKSNIEASGRLKDTRGNPSLQFKTQLALGELGRLAKLTERPEGIVILNGKASLDAANNYKADGNIDARGVSFQEGKQRFSNLNLVSALHVDPHNIDLQGMHLRAFGGEYLGNGLLRDFAQYRLQGSVRNLDLQAAAQVFGQKIPYDGVASGPVDVQGNLKTAGTKSIVGSAHLTIAPGRRGIPFSGRLNAEYNGATDNVVVQNSYLTLPHSHLTLSGSVGKTLTIALTSTDLNDLLAAAGLQGAPPVVLNQGGAADFNGTVTGSLSAPQIAGHLVMRNFSVQGRAFNNAAADLNVSASNAAVHNGSITRALMSAQFDANVGLHNWSAPPAAPLRANLNLTNGDLADAMALAGQPSAGYSGAVTATAHIAGTVADPQGSASIQAANGTLHGEPYDQLQAQVNLADQLVTIPSAFVQSAAGRVNLTGEFHHPRDSFSTGQLHAHAQSNQVDLAKVRTVQSNQPNSAGTLQLNADMTATLTPAEFLVTAVNGNVSANGLKIEGQNYGDFAASAQTKGQTVAYNVTSDFAGSNLRVNGSTQLVHDYPTTADANIANLPVERMLALAKRTDIPARGVLSGTAHVTGTLSNPQGNADLDLVRAVVYNEPLDRVHARVNYLPQSIDVSQFEAVAGPSRIDLTAHYDHPAGNLQQGTARFNLTSSHIDLARIHNVQSWRSGLGGTLDVSANGTASVHEAALNKSGPRVLFSALNANVSATGIAAQGRNYGDLKLTASTTGNNRLNFALDSNLTGAAIHGTGNAELTGNYPVDANLTFTNVMWTHVRNLLGLDTGGPSSFEAVTDGHLTINGPALQTNQLNGALQLSRLNFTTLPRAGGGKVIAIANQGPVSASLDHGAVHIQNAHLTGPNTDIQATGTASIQDGTMNIGLNANADITILQSFDRDLYSTGQVALAATVRGTVAQPLINGQLTLKDASVNYASLPVGISNANGTILFGGNNARIQSFTAESGGGKVSVTGFAGFSGTPRFALRTALSNVRLRVQQGVSVTADADIRLTGTSDASVVSGSATIQQLTYAPQSDFGSILSRAGPPVQSPAAPLPLLDNMKLDIRVRTAPGMAVQASLAQNLQADADLRIRGTAAEPGVLGRITISDGQLVFFGSQYRVDTGTISFYNPVRVEPVLDISLETAAKGVTVTLHVTGPIDDMKLSYTSDPPLQFQEIVTLLASGKTPTSDPTLLANQPTQPAQGFQQMGESAILSRALADPVSSRLERVFGVTQFKIDPSFTTGSDVPTARLTLQQRITNNLTFTYVSAIDDPNSTIIRIEFAISPQFSAVATRDQYGIFSVNFYYKKQFR
ncbi:MAG: translocation/assembly module TamB domain-containing protein [Terriglobia bacterium]